MATGSPDPRIEITEVTALLPEQQTNDEAQSHFDAIAMYTFPNAEYMVKFQETLRNYKSFGVICNILRHIWSDEIVFFTIPVMIWIVQGKIGITILFICDYSEVFNGFLKWMIQKPRPFWVIPEMSNLGGDWPYDYSFPSSHAQYSFSWSFAIILTLYNVTPSYIIALIIILPTFTAISRVYLGVHAFECVICGSFIGIIFATAICYIFPYLFVWFEGLTPAEGFFFVLFATFIIPYLGFYLILKLFPAPNAQVIQQWTQNALHNTYTEEQIVHIDDLPLRKREIDPRKYSTYHLPICALFGGAVGSMILLYDTSLVPGFLEESCKVTADNITNVLFTVFIGICGSAVLFPLAIFLPSKLKDAEQIITAAVVQMVFCFLFGLWAMVGPPYISYVALGARSCEALY